MSRRHTNFLLLSLRLLVTLAFTTDQKLPTLQNHIRLYQIPGCIETAVKKFNVDTIRTVYACCPVCSTLYAPDCREMGKGYPEECDARRSLCADPCRAALLRLPSKLPLRPFLYPHFKDYLARLLCRGDIEPSLRSCYIQGQLNEVLDNSTLLRTPFHGSFLRSLKDSSGLPFFGHETEYRLAFSCSVDWFNVNRSSNRSAQTSIGVIVLFCLNIPFQSRYDHQNAFVIVIPGPNQPSEVDTNHFIRPLIDELLQLWNPGIHYTSTAENADGRICKCVIAPMVCDLMAARKIAALAAHSAHQFCSVCELNSSNDSFDGVDSRGRVDHPWSLRSVDEMRDHAEMWYAAPSNHIRKEMFSITGVRWSELWRLPYWNPVQQLVIDPMHCLYEGIVPNHFRHFLRLTEEQVDGDGSKRVNVYEHHFSVPSDHNTTGLNDKELRQILLIHKDLTTPFWEGLEKRLVGRHKKCLQFICRDLSLTSSGSKPILARRLVNWVGLSSLVTILSF
jgi:hypothetical protein